MQLTFPFLLFQAEFDELWTLEAGNEGNSSTGCAGLKSYIWQAGYKNWKRTALE